MRTHLHPRRRERVSVADDVSEATVLLRRDAVRGRLHLGLRVAPPNRDAALEVGQQARTLSVTGARWQQAAADAYSRDACQETRRVPE